MAVEPRRGCGFRRVGGLYFVGGLLGAPCDRLPYPLTICPTCGQGIKVSRGFTRINPLKAFGTHDEEATCKDKQRPCIMCDPTEDVAYIMLVGEKFYNIKSFTAEANTLGVCKRIPFIPQEFKVGETVIYLAHKKACLKNGDSDADKKGRIKMLQESCGIFSAFKPHSIEKLFWESQLKGKKGEALKKKLEKQGITPVSIPDGDEDHK